MAVFRTLVLLLDAGQFSALKEVDELYVFIQLYYL